MTFRRRTQAFSLIEVTMAIGIAAFCLVVIFALLPTGLNSNQTSVQQTIAAGLAASIVADMRAAPRGGASPLYQLTPDTASPGTPLLYLNEDGTKTGDKNEAEYAAKVEITLPTVVPGPTSVHIVISWPAAAPKPSNFFEAITALDRNP